MLEVRLTDRGDYAVQNIGAEYAWTQFTDRGIAEKYAAWLEENFDLEGLYHRLTTGTLTEADHEDIRAMSRRMMHETFVRKDEPSIYAQQYPERVNCELSFMP